MGEMAANSQARQKNGCTFKVPEPSNAMGLVCSDMWLPNQGSRLAFSVWGSEIKKRDHPQKSGTIPWQKRKHGTANPFR